MKYEIEDRHMNGRYPTHMLTNGMIVKFKCLNCEGLELYQHIFNSRITVVRDTNGTWSVTGPAPGYKRRAPLFGVTVLKENIS